MNTEDILALCYFGLLWLGYNWATDRRTIFGRISLTRLMAEHRRRWIMNSLHRDLKMIDTQIMAGLQAGTAFFASTTIFALGGCFALLGQTDRVQAIFNDLPFGLPGDRTAFELKVGGLACLLGYAFFKFGWSYRLFNYCSILIGAIPMTQQAERDRPAAERAAERAVVMNVQAGMHFNAGLRAIFLSIGYLGWFVGAYVFMVTTSFVLFVLLRRQFFSPARRVLVPETAAETGSGR